ncbi:MAG: hypothetical protein HZT40_19410 [Candidatus Thiothrix singaporensis]|uniref:Uncharacterized protein n=1 Tax=Candidatus Thiothrix singaporensis TaxID=2799669 RepID=A0A7L6AWP2_9GAMM|nr:MAG: hypothetical protein HZT40_19410 [Candidatus Thiothrix singaporensis]
MTDEKQNPTTETPATDNAATAGGGADHHSHDRGCWRHHHCHGRPRRWKIFGAVALIALFGFVLGKASGHHHCDYGHYGQRFEQQQMQSDASASRSESLSVILDGIEATPQQRSKAVQLFR